MADDVKTEEPKPPEEPCFVVTGAMTAVRKHLNTKQRTSSYFNEAPVVLGKTLRRGAKVKLTSTQMKLNEIPLKRLFEAHAIEIYRVDEAGELVSLRESMEEHEQALKDSRYESENEPQGEKPPEAPSSETITPPYEPQPVTVPTDPPHPEVSESTEVVQAEDSTDKVDDAGTHADPSSHKRAKRHR